VALIRCKKPQTLAQRIIEGKHASHTLVCNVAQPTHRGLLIFVVVQRQARKLFERLASHDRIVKIDDI
jgi:hypothetical protein